MRPKSNTQGIGTLVVTRKRGESIRIGDDIIVTVESTRGHDARLRITAPRSILVLREELVAGERGSG